MLSRIDLRGRKPAALAPAALAALLPRAVLDVGAALDAVRPVCADVRARGGAAVREYSQKFDGVDVASTRVPARELSAALAALDPAVRAALTEAARRARLVHEAQVPAETWTAVAAGSTVTERYLPVRRAGVYVPGGLVA
ncbi:MAG TPA: histidinol dehydrogenase, partial [Streptosporangiaceae bacterium]|nr:histidinol dehydrogenase [Streptosporangiaceae bacterium]